MAASDTCTRFGMRRFLRRGRSALLLIVNGSSAAQSGAPDHVPAQPRSDPDSDDTACQLLLDASPVPQTAVALPAGGGQPLCPASSPAPQALIVRIDDRILSTRPHYGPVPPGQSLYLLRTLRLLI